MNAPGQPGIPPAWTSSAKDAVTTALGASRVWLTIGHGILDEVYWPRVDSPQIRDLGFIVADDQGFWNEAKRLDDYEPVTPADGSCAGGTLGPVADGPGRAGAGRTISPNLSPGCYGRPATAPHGWR